MMENTNMVTVTETALKTFCVDVLRHVGVATSQATLIIDNLVTADMRGVDSHGVVRLPLYVKRLAVGVINPRPSVRIVHETATSAVVDGDNGLGQWVGMKGMEIAIDKALSGACAFVSVRNSNHFGAAAYYAEMAAACDLIGIALTIGSINHMTPWGGAEAILGNNPFAVAMPAGVEPAIVLDMACSVAARGKIIVAAKEGHAIPADWAVGPDGVATTDAVEALKGFMQPVGGPKGYALTLVVGLLSTMLSGAFFGSEVTHLYDDLERPQNTGHLFAAIPISVFENIDRYKSRMDKAIAEVRGVERAAGVDRIFLPGEREIISFHACRRAGIPIASAIFDELVEVGRTYGVTLDRA
jgi:LDH2 family malate/lactate/ureidoglycolate dehydrogenase